MTDYITASPPRKSGRAGADPRRPRAADRAPSASPTACRSTTRPGARSPSPRAASTCWSRHRRGPARHASVARRRPRPRRLRRRTGRTGRARERRSPRRAAGDAVGRGLRGIGFAAARRPLHAAEARRARRPGRRRHARRRAGRAAARARHRQRPLSQRSGAVEGGRPTPTRSLGSLRKLGFTVTVAENQSRQAMSEALLHFDSAVESGDTVFFFFAGHGFEIHGAQLFAADRRAGGDRRAGRAGPGRLLRGRHA